MRFGIPIVATGTAAMAAIATYYATYSVRSQWLGQTYWHGCRNRNAVALTFDDGPSADTEDVLDILADYQVPATFFMVGRQVETFPGIAQRVSAEGHGVGNHSYSHPIYLFHGSSETREQLQRTQDLISETIGVRPTVARPPGGVRTRAYFRAARSLDLRTVQWDVSGFDWKRISPRQIADNVLRRVRPGSIILLHDGDSEGKKDRRNTVVALPLIIKRLTAHGLEIAPLTQLLPDD